jgi:erythromycin esterase-like protein
MAILDKIAQEKQRISKRLMRVDAERTKLSDQLNELEIAERALNRFGRKAAAIGRRSRGGAAGTAPTAGEKRRARGGQPAPNLSLRDAALKAVQAHANGASANEVLDYLSRQFGMTARPNHLGSALQGHRRAGRLENRDHRWYLPPSA